MNFSWYINIPYQLKVTDINKRSFKRKYMTLTIKECTYQSLRLKANLNYWS